MGALRTIGNILAGIAIIFGFLFILGAFSPQAASSTGWLLTGLLLLLVGFGIIGGLAFLTKNQKGPNGEVPGTVLKVDLPADVAMERFKCQDCGAQLTMDNVKMVAGAPMVNCPYCNAAYQLSEAPKW